MGGFRARLSEMEAHTQLIRAFVRGGDMTDLFTLKTLEDCRIFIRSDWCDTEEEFCQLPIIARLDENIKRIKESA